MAVAPLMLGKPKLTLDEFKTLQKAAKAETRSVLDAFANPVARLGFGAPNLAEGAQYPLTRLTRNYILMVSLYRSNWIVRKVVDAKAEDMLKNWIMITSENDPDDLDEFNSVIDETRTQEKLCEAIKWARLYGGSGALIVLKGHEDLEEPLEIEDVEPDSYKGLLVFDRWAGIQPGPDLVRDINDPVNFGLPASYRIMTDGQGTQMVHHSRILRFTGRTLPRWEQMAEQYWGISEVEVMYDELRKRDNTSWNIASLVFRANIMAMKQKDLSQLLSGASNNQAAAQRFWTTMQAISEMMSNQGLMILPEEGGLENHPYTFSGISDVYQNFMLDICGATEYTMSRLFGRTITGLGQGNEGDEHQYYSQIGQKQKQELDPQLKRLLPIVAMSTWGEVPDDFAWTYLPANSMTDKDRSDLAKSNTDSVNEAFNSGIVGRKTALQELKQQSDTTGLWTNITDEQIEEAEEEPMQMGEGMGMPGEEGGGMPAGASGEGDEGGGPGGEGDDEADEPKSGTDLLMKQMQEEERDEGEPAPKKKGQDADLIAIDPDYISTETEDLHRELMHPGVGTTTRREGLKLRSKVKHLQSKLERRAKGVVSRSGEKNLKWEETKHPRGGKGSQKGGQFVSKGQGGGGTAGKAQKVGEEKQKLRLASHARRFKQPGLFAQGEGTKKLRSHLQNLEAQLKVEHPDWDMKRLAQELKPHVESGRKKIGEEFEKKKRDEDAQKKLKSELRRREEEQKKLRAMLQVVPGGFIANGKMFRFRADAEGELLKMQGKEPGLLTVQKVLKDPAMQDKAVMAYQKGGVKKMEAALKAVGLPVMAGRVRQQMRQMLKKKGVLRAAGGWQIAQSIPAQMVGPLADKIAALENHLKTAKSTSHKPLKQGEHANQVWHVQFNDGSQAAFKPHKGERVLRDNIRVGKQTEREVGAWEIAKIVGLDDMVVPAVERNIDGERGVALDWQANAEDAMDIADRKQRYDGFDDQRRAAVFDYVLGNTDRHEGNWMLRNGKIRLLDHGLCFPEDDKDYSRNSFLKNLSKQYARDNKIGQEDISHFGQLYKGKKQQIVSKLQQLGLPGGAVRGVERRIEQLAVMNRWGQMYFRNYKKNFGVSVW